MAPPSVATLCGLPWLCGGAAQARDAPTVAEVTRGVAEAVDHDTRGSGSSTNNIAIVTRHIGSHDVVVPTMSSPAIAIDTPVRIVDRLVGNTADTLELEGLAYADGEAMCCPPVRKRFTMKQDDKGNWKSMRKRIIPGKNK